jgi:hypothetical protein
VSSEGRGQLPDLSPIGACPYVLGGREFVRPIGVRSGPGVAPVRAGPDVVAPYPLLLTIPPHTLQSIRWSSDLVGDFPHLMTASSLPPRPRARLETLGE